MKWINGNKTIVGQILIIILMIFKDATWMQPEIFNAAMSIIVLLTGASAVHHVKKQIKK